MMEVPGLLWRASISHDTAITVLTMGHFLIQTDNCTMEEMEDHYSASSNIGNIKFIVNMYRYATLC